jgi:hypothetical protein
MGMYGGPYLDILMGMYESPYTFILMNKCRFPYIASLMGRYSSLALMRRFIYSHFKGEI